LIFLIKQDTDREVRDMDENTVVAPKVDLRGITEKLDIIAGELQGERPELALALDLISDKIDRAATSRIVRVKGWSIVPGQHPDYPSRSLCTVTAPDGDTANVAKTPKLIESVIKGGVKDLKDLADKLSKYDTEK
jgi:hypothetical protein